MNKNLIPMNERTKEEQREIARKGGRESGKVRRRKRTMKDAAQLILQLPVGAEQAALLQKYGIAESDCTNLMLLSPPDKDCIWFAPHPLRPHRSPRHAPYSRGAPNWDKRPSPAPCVS